MNHSRSFVPRRGNHINGIENFWNQSKRVLHRYNGIPSKHFFPLLKEYGFRFNDGSPRKQLAALKSWVDI